jgi:hypothetical protein
MWLCIHQPCSAQMLKSVVYDFDGFDLGATDLPEGDYSFGDLTYKVSANPLPASDMLGDRVLQLDVTWNQGYAAFGRGISRFLQLQPSGDQLNFYFYNPVANQQPSEVIVSIADDDNLSNTHETASDDSWKKTISVPVGPGWQLISIPLIDFTDSNTGGNGVFDVGWSSSGGMLLLVELRFNKPLSAPAAATYYIDMICFSDGPMPVGANALQLPAKHTSDYCRVGAHQFETPGNYHQIPAHFEGLFPVTANRKLKYVNTYMQWATNGSTAPHALPGAGYQTLISNGYRPIITWEPMFSGHGFLDPVQPRLQDIIDGDFDAYIDAFADKIKTYTDTLIIRPMHEFDGDWYAWCISQNGQDPQKFVLAWRRIVDRFNAKGVNNVQWMWCPNSDPVPHRYWNWIVSAYPGDQYVDLVGTDVYNAHYPESLPWWRSFRWQTSECYYYFRKHFPAKPVIICELACRERMAGEPATSQTKAGWWQVVDKDLQSFFSKVRGIVFFSENKTQTWAVNTSVESVNSLRDNIWFDDYYFLTPVSIQAVAEEKDLLSLYPSPCSDRIKIRSGNKPFRVSLCDMNGRMVLQTVIQRNAENETEIDVGELPEGLYHAKIEYDEGRSYSRKLVIVN